jgi:ADP-ribose pyrophosphatase
MAYELISSESTYQGKAFSVRRDQLRLPDGSLARLDIVEHVGAVTVLPFDEAGQIWFVRQYRHAAGLELLELPAGTLEPDEEPEACALREIREETGMAAGRLQKIGEFFLAPGYSTEYMYVFLAGDLTHDPLPGDADEFLSVERFPLAQVEAMLLNGEIQDAKTIAALALGRPFLA